jgi:hypothetical protein
MNYVGMSRSGTVFFEMGLAEARSLKVLCSSITLPPGLEEAKANAIQEPSQEPAPVKRASARRSSGRVRKVKQCTECGKDFHPHTSEKTCSELCSKARENKIKTASARRIRAQAKAPQPSRLAMIRDADRRAAARMNAERAFPVDSTTGRTMPIKDEDLV